MKTAEEWVIDEYEGENVDKWVFTRNDMEEAFRAGAKEERQKIADQVKALTVNQITYSETLYKAILKG